MKQVQQGQTVRVTATFKDFSDALVDPTAVEFFSDREADETVTSDIYGSMGSKVVKSSTGIYYWPIDTTPQSGLWRWRVIGTGPAGNAAQGSFYVVPNAIGEGESSS